VDKQKNVIQKSLLATITTAGGSGSSINCRVRRPLHPHVWHEAPIESIPINELNEIMTTLYPTLPIKVIESILQVFRVLDQSGCIHDSSIQQHEEKGAIDRNL
jgi:hypothetical protein